MERNADLIEKAGELLAAGTVRGLSAEIASQTADTRTLAVTTKSLTSLDVYNGPRPVRNATVLDGINPVTIPLPATTVRLEGFAGDDLVAAQQLALR